MERTCSSCRFWFPTAVNDRFGGADPVVGRCEPARTESDWRPEPMCWPSRAVSWDGDEPGDTGALLLTAAAFSCSAWRADGPGSEQ
jgi:hypothetical protein